MEVVSQQNKVEAREIGGEESSSFTIWVSRRNLK